MSMSVTDNDQSTPKGGDSITVLYVDTDKTLADTYAERFETSGHRFHYIRDPRGISQNIKMHAPDVLLMEIAFDHMNGDDAIRGLRKKGLTLPIVVLSRTVSRQMLLDMKQWGVDGFYLKPVSAEALESRLVAVVASRKTAHQRKSGVPTVLIMTGNSSLNANSYETLPLSVINEYGFNIMFVYTSREAVEMLKSAGNGIRLILVDGNDPDYVKTIAQLAGIIQLKMKIQLFAIAGKELRR